MKKILFILPLFLLFTCKSDDDSNIDNEPDSSTTILIDIEGLNIDYTDVTALSSDVEIEINSEGAFANPYTHNGVEDLPVLLLRNQEYLFGYFPVSIANNRVTIDDIVLFYYMMYPLIAIQGYDITTVKNGMLNYSNYEEVKLNVVESINNNESVYENEVVLTALRTFYSDIISGGSLNRNAYDSNDASEIVDQFKFTYNRDGLVQWSDEVPLFSNLGFIIKNETTDEIVFGPEILKTKNLELSATSAARFIRDIVQIDPVPPSESYMLSNAGDFSILFSNGYSTNQELNTAINTANKNQFASTALAIILTNGLKTVAGNNECRQKINDFHAVFLNYINTSIISGTPPSQDELLQYLKDSSLAVADAMNECIVGNTFKKYISVIIGVVGGVLNNALDISELLFLMRDYFNSDITFTETRHFNNSISFGELQQTLLTSDQLSGSFDDNIMFKALMEEKEIVYDVNRPVLVTGSSSFIPNESFIIAQDLPFITSLTSGDVDIVQSNPESDHLGELRVDFIMNYENSEVSLEPDFNTNQQISQNITLTNIPKMRLIGNLNYGEVNVDTTSDKNLTIENQSSVPLVISDILLPDGFFATWTAGTIPAQSTQDVTVVFDPETEQEYSGNLTVVNNLDQINNTIQVNGMGIDDSECGNSTISNSICYGDNEDLVVTHEMVDQEYLMELTFNSGGIESYDVLEVWTSQGVIFSSEWVALEVGNLNNLGDLGLTLSFTGDVEIRIVSDSTISCSGGTGSFSYNTISYTISCYSD